MTDDRMFVWSKEARDAFLAAAAKGNGRFNIGAGLDAALRLDGPVLAATILERMIPHLASLNRTLVLKPGPDGRVVLKVDEDLIRFVVQNHVPPEADARMLDDAILDGGPNVPPDTYLGQEPMT